MPAWLTRDWGLKLTALGLAVGLWYYALGEEGIQVSRKIPLQIQVQNPKISILRSAVKEVEVTLSAPRALLADLTSTSIRAVHQIGEDIKSGDYSFRLTGRDIEVPSRQIRVDRIEPEVIQLTLDELIAIKVAVEPQFVGEHDFGYKVDSKQIQMNPNAVLVEGPKGVLEQLSSVKTEKVELVGRIRSFRRTVSLELPVLVRSLSETLIDLYVPIKEESQEKTFEKIPVKILHDSGDPPKVSVEPEEVAFAIAGSARALEKLTADSLRAYVDITGLDHGVHEVPISLVLPEGTSLKGPEPLVVRVEIKKS